MYCVRSDIALWWYSYILPHFCKDVHRQMTFSLFLCNRRLVHYWTVTVVFYSGEQISRVVNAAGQPKARLIK